MRIRRTSGSSVRLQLRAPEDLDGTAQTTYGIPPFYHGSVEEETGRQRRRSVGPNGRLRRCKWRMDSEAEPVVEGERNTKQKGTGTGGCCFNRRVPSISDQSLLSAFGASPPSASHSCKKFPLPRNHFSSSPLARFQRSPIHEQEHMQYTCFT